MCYKIGLFYLLLTPQYGLNPLSNILFEGLIHKAAYRQYAKIVNRETVFFKKEKHLYVKYVK